MSPPLLGNIYTFVDSQAGLPPDDTLTTTCMLGRVAEAVVSADDDGVAVVTSVGTTPTSPIGGVMSAVAMTYVSAFHTVEQCLHACV